MKFTTHMMVLVLEKLFQVTYIRRSSSLTLKCTYCTSQYLTIFALQLLLSRYRYKNHIIDTYPYKRTAAAALGDSNDGYG